jgi:hypothetical protein
MTINELTSSYKSISLPIGVHMERHFCVILVRGSLVTLPQFFCLSQIQFWKPPLPRWQHNRRPVTLLPASFSIRVTLHPLHELIVAAVPPPPPPPSCCQQHKNCTVLTLRVYYSRFKMSLKRLIPLLDRVLVSLKPKPVSISPSKHSCGSGGAFDCKDSNRRNVCACFGRAYALSLFSLLPPTLAHALFLQLHPRSSSVVLFSSLQQKYTAKLQECNKQFVRDTQAQLYKTVMP